MVRENWKILAYVFSPKGCDKRKLIKSWSMKNLQILMGTRKSKPQINW